MIRGSVDQGLDPSNQVKRESGMGKGKRMVAREKKNAGKFQGTNQLGGEGGKELQKIRRRAGKRKYDANKSKSELRRPKKPVRGA